MKTRVLLSCGMGGLGVAVAFAVVVACSTDRSDSEPVGTSAAALVVDAGEGGVIRVWNSGGPVVELDARPKDYGDGAPAPIPAPPPWRPSRH